ncbi:DUF2188 domain-containing protein [Cupriavidus oxalaticus]|uniref:DUF2188 domain-containing protein n=1 Tax=Cupriavidus oxalaticus TaxID=96344 RepID=A0A375FML3_9BURK|nr:DUF2188 domain-containing protein [Cupriavidus oxalaticus]QEZ44844.1 DUF2188 domain-containing protein [Cupriavidus oxalaticus]QRQ83779.1 DUF2188 domain-containing protein [Cupriavidus oxalaticus]QRQ92132.1 DUF2188 domain-containing protein [Cupriavidus oxalaticus]WQD86731.1 DUF2188 domain-containing protein [Cupriavidus oxalaticus]SPC05010.1 conserved hypothetical protein [Cupriavidus oxalaticus]
MTSRSIHVLPAATDNDNAARDGEWALTIEGMDGMGDGEEATALHFPTQEAAIAEGWTRARQAGVSLCIHGRDGLVRERKIYCRAAGTMSRPGH